MSPSLVQFMSPRVQSTMSPETVYEYSLCPQSTVYVPRVPRVQFMSQEFLCPQSTVYEFMFQSTVYL